MAEATESSSEAYPANLARAGSDAADGIGERVKAFRNMRGLRVSDLARTVGVSPSLISQIERAQSRPSVATLFALARALAVPIDDFFTEELRPSSKSDHASLHAPGTSRALPATGATSSGSVRALKLGVEWPRQTDVRHRYVLSRGDRAILDIEGGIRWERLTPVALEGLEFLEIIYAPGSESNPVPYTHGGVEFVTLLEGRLEVYIGFERHVLEPGDSTIFPSSLPHRYVNTSDFPARGISVILLETAESARRGAPSNKE
jgi:transcriptional regulator with XRE-family HTH domain